MTGKVGRTPKPVVREKSTKTRHLSKTHQRRVSVLDEPWSIATLREYPISSEALGVVLEISRRQYHLLKEGLKKKALPLGTTADDIRMPLSIRFVIWVDRLRRLTSDIDLLWRYARRYALQDQFSETSGIKLGDSLDKEFIRELAQARRQSRKGGRKVRISSDDLSEFLNRLEGRYII